MEKEKKVRAIISIALLLLGIKMLAIFAATNIQFLKAVTLGVGTALILGSPVFYKTANRRY